MGDREPDKLALDETVLPALKKLGITDPLVQTIEASADAQTATLQAEAPLIVQRFRQAGVTSVIPLIPFNSFFPYLQSETSQDYFPHLLLSDYESSIQVALGLIPVPYEKALDGQEGVTTLTLGGIDDDRPESQGGYDPGLRSCYAVWKAHNKPPPPPDSPFLEEQGPVAAWCQVIRLFAQAANSARPHVEPAHLRPGHVEDRELPGHLHADPQLQPRQVLRADGVPGGEDPQQRPAQLGLHPAALHQEAPGNVLGRGAGLEATHHVMRATRNFSPWASWMLKLAETEPLDPIPLDAVDLRELDAWRGRVRGHDWSRRSDPLRRGCRSTSRSRTRRSVEEFGYRRERVVFDTEATMSVPAYLLVPLGS